MVDKNDYRRLVELVAKSLSSEEMVFVESPLLRERTGKLRTVDILIEFEMGELGLVRTVVECIQQPEPVNILLIDGLISKYSDLETEVNKKIVVSSSGYTESAQSKARVNGLITWTLEKALVTDWPSELARLAVASVRSSPLYTWTCNFSPPLPMIDNDLMFLSLPVINQEYELVGTLESFLKHHCKQPTEQLFSSTLRDKMKVLSDLRDVITGEFKLEFQTPFYVLDLEEEKHRLNYAVTVVTLPIEFAPLESEYTILDGDKRIIGRTIIEDYELVHLYSPDLESLEFHKIPLSNDPNDDDVTSLLPAEMPEATSGENNNTDDHSLVANVPRIFLSYSRQNIEFVDKLYQDLKSLSGDLWMDIYDLRISKSWSNEVQQGLETCDVMILVQSQDSRDSKQVQKEWLYFINGLKKPIIPLRYEDLDKFHYQIDDLQYINFVNRDYLECLHELVIELNSLYLG